MSSVGNRRGSAYIFVLVAMLLVSMLAGVALTVTISSRRITARYVDFSGLYNLAVGANEQALFTIRDALVANAMALQPAPPLQVMQAAALAFGPRNWEMAVAISYDDAVLRHDVYQFSTTLTPVGERVRVQTRVERDAPLPIPATVRAYIVLDGNTARMVHSMRITM